QRMLLRGVHDDAEGAGAVQQIRDVVRELLHAGTRGGVRVTKRGEHAADELALVCRVGTGHGRAVVVPDERWHAGHDPGTLHPAAMHHEAVRRARVDAHDRSRDDGGGGREDAAAAHGWRSSDRCAGIGSVTVTVVPTPTFESTAILPANMLRITLCTTTSPMPLPSPNSLVV